MGYYRSLSHKIQTALSFHLSDWSILLRAWVWLLRVDLLLRTRPFARVQVTMERWSKPRRALPPEQAWEQIRRYQRFVILAARLHLYPMRCLRQSLALQVMLGGQGIATTLRIGVRKEAEQFWAHAWLEYEGQSIELSNSYETFKPLAPLENTP